VTAPAFKGGQGRTEHDIRADGRFAFWHVLGFLALLVVVAIVRRCA
jgi:hypothetical protein